MPTYKIIFIFASITKKLLRCIEFIEMGCLKLTYRQETDFRVIYSKKELTFKNSSEKTYRSYLYGFNGKERDNEISGNGNSYDFGARMYNPRVGRFLTLDSKMKNHPSESSYSAFRNSPILYIDHDGNEWVNAYDVEVEKAKKALLNNPDNKRLQDDLNNAIKNQATVNRVIKDLKTNDVALYNYIDNLKVKDARTGESIKVKVTVALGAYSEKEGTEDAVTHYSNQTSQSKNKYVEYEGLEEKYAITPGPVNKNDEIGFDITLFSSAEWADIYLSNEAGDVMYRMEYPDASISSGSDKGKTMNEYLKKGSAGDYSNRVEEMYSKRKESGEGKNLNNNPYPLKNESDENE